MALVIFRTADKRGDEYHQFRLVYCGRGGIASSSDECVLTVKNTYGS